MMIRGLGLGISKLCKETKHVNRTCPVCAVPVQNEGRFLNHLSDGTIVCEKCAARTRFLYPVAADTKKDSYREEVNTGVTKRVRTEYYERKIIKYMLRETTG